MKLKLLLLSLVAGIFSGCYKPYDDTDITKQIEELEGSSAALESLCARLNTDMTMVSRLAEAKALNNKAVEVTPRKDGDKVTGYSVLLSDGSILEITCPSDGKDGYIGNPGADAQVPVVGAADFEGQQCWTLNGEFLKVDGAPVPLYSHAEGEKRDGRTPKLKVENGKWYSTFAENPTEADWTEIHVGVLYGDGNIFSAVNVEDGNAVFELSSGETLTLPMAKKLLLTLTSASGQLAPGGTCEVDYTLESDDESVTVEIFAPAGWTASASAGKVSITSAADAQAEMTVQVVVFATESDGESVFQVVNITVKEDQA